MRILGVALVVSMSACGGSDLAGPTMPVADPQAEFFTNATGTWQGSNTLWLKYPENPQKSAARLVVSSGRIDYEWAYEGKPQTGTFVFAGSGDSISASWTDTWHSKQPMALNGTFDNGVIKVFGTYSVGDGPDWGWRAEFHQTGPDKLAMKMYNILPDGVFPESPRELLAVDMVLTRAPN